MSTLLYVCMTILVGIARGIHEGMIHIQFGDRMHSIQFAEGIRGHIWAPYRHRVSVVRDGLLLLLGSMIVREPPSMNLLPALLFILWEATELGYNIARYWAIKPYEHINFADIISTTLTGKKVYALHVFRVLAAIYVLVKFH